MVIFVLNEKSEFDCVLRITDDIGTKEYLLSTLNCEQGSSNYIETEIQGDSIEVSLSPQSSDYSSALKEMEKGGLVGKVTAKFLSKALCDEEDYFLLAECKYNLSGIEDGSIVEINQQMYPCSQLPISSIFDAFSIRYWFFEASCRTKLFDLLEAKVLNRNEVLRSYKKFAMNSLGSMSIVWKYPLKMNYAKHYAKDETASEKLIEFNKMDEKQREDIIKRNKIFTDFIE